jgi:hypothetical protein
VLEPFPLGRALRFFLENALLLLGIRLLSAKSIPPVIRGRHGN